MASNLCSDGLEPKSDGLQPTSDNLLVMASKLLASCHTREQWPPTYVAMASNLRAMACNLLVTTY